MEPIKLHSNHLFHFKKDINILKLILRDGYQHRLWKEKIPFFGLTQENFIVCFTDLRAQDLGFHLHCYGKNALVMTKEWARKNKISPVRYIHKASPGMDESYMHLKMLFRNAMKHKLTVHKIVSYLATVEMYLEGSLPQGDITLGNLFGEDLITLYKTRCQKIDEQLRSSETGYNQAFSMFLMVKKLHDELELRDAYLRIYIDNFECPGTRETVSNKVLYDEREWRSIVLLDNNDDQDPYIRKCCTEGFLPKQFNLTFSDIDVIAILVETEEQKFEIVELLNSNCSLLTSSSLHKVLLFDEYDKDNSETTDAQELTGRLHRIKVKVDPDQNLDDI